MAQPQKSFNFLSAKDPILSNVDDVVNSIAQVAINFEDIATDHHETPLLEEHVSVPSSLHSPQRLQIELLTQDDPEPEPVLVEVLPQETIDGLVFPIVSLPQISEVAPAN